MPTNTKSELDKELNRLNEEIRIHLPSGDVLLFLAADVLEAVDPHRYKKELKFIETD